MLPTIKCFSFQQGLWNVKDNNVSISALTYNYRLSKFSDTSVLEGRNIQ